MRLFSCSVDRLTAVWTARLNDGPVSGASFFRKFKPITTRMLIYFMLQMWQKLSRFEFQVTYVENASRETLAKEDVNN